MPDRNALRRQASNRYHAMIRRCYDPRYEKFKNYGGRGITVCHRWLQSFANYYADTGDRPASGLTLDRIDNDGNYEPGNVRWATFSEQNMNKRKPTYLGRRATARELKSACPTGHPYDEANTYWLHGTIRRCRACKAASNRRRRALASI